MSVDKANLALLIDLLNRAGKNTDAAGTSTIFAQLAQIRQYTDTLETLLGLTGDVASGNGTIMARLAQLIAYTDTLEATEAAIKAKTDLIGASADAAGTSTIFARLAQIAAYVDTVETTEAAIKAKTDLIGTSSGAFGGVKSIQKGNIALVAPADVTISAVVPSKSIVLFGGNTQYITRAYLSSATNIRFESGTSTSQDISWQVIEYNI